MAVGREADARCCECGLIHRRDSRGPWAVIGPLRVVVESGDLEPRRLTTKAWVDPRALSRIQFETLPQELRRARIDDLLVQ